MMVRKAGTQQTCGASNIILGKFRRHFFKVILRSFRKGLQYISLRKSKNGPYLKNVAL
jgi:hypothetical protein